MIPSSVNRVVYKGNGSATEFPCPFKIFDRTNIKVLLIDGEGNRKVLTSDYYVEMDTMKVLYPGYAPGAEEPEADKPHILTEGETLVIYRELPITQMDQLPDNYPFNVIEKMGDKSCIIDQQLADELERSLKLGVELSATDFDSTLPIKPGYGWRVSEDGTKIELLANPEEIYNKALVIKKEIDIDKAAIENYKNSAETYSINAIAASINAESAKEIAVSKADKATEMADAVEVYYNAVAAPYDAGRLYKAGELVFVSSGELYRALVDVQGETPASSFSWVKVQNNMLTAFEMDEYGDLMPRVNPQASTIWDFDENGDITPTAYGSGDETHGADEQIIENQRNIAANKLAIENLTINKADKSEVSQQSDEIVQTQLELAEQKKINKQQQREIDLLKDFTEGVAWRSEIDTEEAYTKAIPKGAKGVTINSIGGKCIVENQLFHNTLTNDRGLAYINNSDGSITLNGTTIGGYVNFTNLEGLRNQNHIYYISLEILENPSAISFYYGWLNRNILTSSITSGKSAKIGTNDTSKANSCGLLGFSAGTVFENVKIRIQEIDLTQMFGAGNEPTVEEFEAMFPNYIPYTEPTIKTICCDSVEVKGKNKWNKDNFIWQNGTYRYTKLASASTRYTLSVKLKEGKTIPAGAFFGFSSEGDYSTTQATLWCVSNGTITNDTRTNIAGLNTYIVCYPPNVIDTIDDYLDIQLEQGTISTSYSPYNVQTLTIPIETLTELQEKGYGQGVNSDVYNYLYVNDEGRKIIRKRIDKIVLDGTQPLNRANWRPSENGVGWIYPYSLTKNAIGQQNLVNNVLASPISAISYSEMFAEKVGICCYYENILGICIWQSNTDLNTVDKVNAYLRANPITVYYELAEPIEYDVTDLMGDFDNTVLCEANGSITFRNTLGDDYRVPIPNELEYIVKVSDAL